MKAVPEEILASKAHTSVSLEAQTQDFLFPFHQESVFKTAVTTLLSNAVTQLLT